MKYHHLEIIILKLTANVTEPRTFIVYQFQRFNELHYEKQFIIFVNRHYFYKRSCYSKHQFNLIP